MLRCTPEITQKCAKGDVASIDAPSVPPICSLCYELLRSGDYEDNYVRQSSSQKRSESKKFLRKYNNEDCQLEQKPGRNVNFEKICRFRLEEKTEEDFKVEKNCTDYCDEKESGPVDNVSISCSGLDVEIDFQPYDNLYQNKLGTLQLDYCFRIKGQEDYQFYVKNLQTNEETTYRKIIGEGSLFLEIPKIPFKYKHHSQNRCKDISTTSEDSQRPETNTEDFSISKYEDVICASNSEEKLTSECSEIRSNEGDSCETIEISSKQEVTNVNSEAPSSKDVSCENIGIMSEEMFKDTSDISKSSTQLLDKLCCNCSQVIGQDIYFCLFGHDSCKQCKGKPCILCQKVMGEARTYCKNHHKGCTILSPQEHLTKHEIDCEFNNFRCPYPRCVFLNNLSDLKFHFLNSHNKSLIQSNNILEVLNGRKDRKWYIHCYDSLFICSYYYYGTHIEFILQYIGANDKAKFYQFEVEIKTMKDGKYSKKAMCAGWNDRSLCKGIYFDYGDLTDCDNSRFQFTANLRIVNNINNGFNASF